jgi:choline dehydrogenase-like flavoprotein
MATSSDVVIRGSGAGGETLARSLVPSGKSILLLEGGDWLPREVLNWDGEAVLVQNLCWLHWTFVQDNRPFENDMPLLLR